MALITSVDTVTVPVNHRGSWVFVAVSTDTGSVGLGEASHSRDDRALSALISHWSTRLTGCNADNILALLSDLPLGDPVFLYSTARSALEQALWDLLGQQLGVPIRQLFGAGSAATEVPLYANINRAVVGRSPEEFAEVAQLAVAEGFTSLKVAPFDEVTGDHRDYRPGIRRIAAVREAIGDEIALAVDCHSRFSPEEAMQLATDLIRYRLMWLEEVVPDSKPDVLAAVRTESGIPAASCENLLGVTQFAPFLNAHIVDVLMPDVKHTGGIAEVGRIAAAAIPAGITVSPHNPAGPVATAASAQAMLPFANTGLLEYAYGEVEWRAELLDPPEVVRDGMLQVNDRPGLGHQLNQEVVHQLLDQTDRLTR